MGLKELLFRSGRSPAVALSGYFTDIQRWDDIYNGGGDWRYTRKDSGRHKAAGFTWGCESAVRGTDTAVLHGGHCNVLFGRRH